MHAVGVGAQERQVEIIAVEARAVIVHAVAVGAQERRVEVIVVEARVPSSCMP